MSADPAASPLGEMSVRLVRISLGTNPSTSSAASGSDVFRTSLSLFDELKLRHLSSRWTSLIWDSQFTDPPTSLPENYLLELDSTDPRKAHRIIFQELAKNAAKFIEERNAKSLEASFNEAALASRRAADSTDTSISDSVTTSSSVESGAEGYWAAIIQHGVKYKRLIALLYYYMAKGQDAMEAKYLDQILAIDATALYIVLLAMPGSGAYKVFHTVLYTKAISTFSLTKKLHLGRSPKKKKKGKKQAPGASTQTQRTNNRRRRPSRPDSPEDCMEENENPNDPDDDLTLSYNEEMSLISALNSLVYHFIVFADRFSMKRASETLEDTIQELVYLTQLETSVPNLDFGREVRRSGKSALAFNGYVALEKLSQELHGPIDRTLRKIFRCLLHSVLMNPRGASELEARELTVIRDHTIHFIKYIITRLGPISHPASEVFIQHLCLQTPDRSEARQKTAHAVVELSSLVPTEVYLKIANWLFRCSHSDRVGQRLMALEVLTKLMMHNRSTDEERESDPAAEMNQNSEETVQHGDGGGQVEAATPVASRLEATTTPDQSSIAPFHTLKNSAPTVLSCHKLVFALLFSRCSDVAPSVRAKALQSLADISERDKAGIIQEMFAKQAESSSRKPTSVDFFRALGNSEESCKWISNISDPLPPATDFLDFLRRRALDDSVFVRKNALQVMENILLASCNDLSSEATEMILSVLTEHCRDPSLLIRKNVAVALSELLRRNPGSQVIVKSWVDGVFPLILDVEQKAAEKVLENVWDLLFGNLRPREVMEASGEACFALPWDILRQMEESKNEKYLSRACGIWAKEGLLKPSILNTLRTYIDSTENERSWLLLSLVSAHVPVKDPKFVMEYFRTKIHSAAGVGLYTLLQVLRVLRGSVESLDEEHRAELKTDLILLIRRFALHPELISTAVDIVTIICQMEAKEDDVAECQKLLDSWTEGIIKYIDNELAILILQPSTNAANGDVPVKVYKMIFTLGELAQASPHLINRRLFLLMQIIVFQKGRQMAPLSQQAPTVDMDQQTQEISPTLNDPNMPSSQTQNSQLQTACMFTPSTRLQALTVVTLAKMCLQNEEKAKKIIPAFGRILDTTDQQAVKNNIVFALGDMGVRYASLIEPLLPQLTTCLRDESIMVRRATLTTLINLLQEDYIKMSSGRGSFFFRILQTLLDPSTELQGLTHFYLTQRLLKRKPKAMFNYFIEAIFHFNEYQGHQTFNKFEMSDREKNLFTLSHSAESRMTLYKFMLEHCADDDRFLLTYRLCQDVLNGALEGHVRLDESPASVSVLKDTLACLASEEIKLSSLRSKTDADPETDVSPETQQQDFRGAMMTAAKKTIISQVVKKNVIENVIPIVVELKHRLENLKSPLINDLMNCLRELMKDYKNEVKELLAADKQLAAEIEFDLKKWEEEQQQKRLEEAQRQGHVLPSQSSEGPMSQVENNQIIRAIVDEALKKYQERQQQLQQQQDQDAGQDADTDVNPDASPGPPNAIANDNNTHAPAVEAETPLERFVSTHSNHESEALTALLSPRVQITDIVRSRRQSRDAPPTNESVPKSRKSLRAELDVIPEEAEIRTSVRPSGPENLEPTSAAEADNENADASLNPPQSTEEEALNDEEANKAAEEQSIANAQKTAAVEGGDNMDCSNLAQEEPQPEEVVHEEEQQLGDDALPASNNENEKNESSGETPPSESSSGHMMPPSDNLKAMKRFTLKRAISTPARKDQCQLTFMNESEDLSAISILSPPTLTEPERKRRKKTNDQSDCSFKFRPGGKARDDLFDQVAQDAVGNDSSKSD